MRLLLDLIILVSCLYEYKHKKSTWILLLGGFYIVETVRTIFSKQLTNSILLTAFSLVELVFILGIVVIFIKKVHKEMHSAR